jgi:SAM-dependent methyltransferase
VTLADASAAEDAWAVQVRANREQVDRVREVPDGRDFYAPVSDLFRADPFRTDDPVLDRLRAVVVPGERWLDIGAGAGRFALPLALVAGEVVAIDPSAGMLAALAEGQASSDIPNVHRIEGRWPPDDDLRRALGPFPVADVALIAHVGYDVEEIGPFVGAMESACRRLCVAVLMERQPAAIADAFWPLVHGEPRVGLPALPAFVSLLEARGRRPELAMVDNPGRRFPNRDDLVAVIRRQLWIVDGSEKHRRFEAALEALVEASEHGFRLRDQPRFPIGDRHLETGLTSGTSRRP